MAAAISRRLCPMMPPSIACSTAAASSRSRACEEAMHNCTVRYMFQVVQGGADDGQVGGCGRADSPCGASDGVGTCLGCHSLSRMGAVAGRQVSAPRGHVASRARRCPVVAVLNPLSRPLPGLDRKDSGG